MPDYFLRFNTSEIRTNQNHFYFVLAAVIDNNRNIRNQSYFTIRQIYEFLNLKLRQDYAAFSKILSAYEYMIQSNQILALSGNTASPDFDTCFRVTILPAFYGPSFVKLPYINYETLASSEPPVPKEKLFHIYLYIHSFKNFYTSGKKMSTDIGISKNTISTAMDYISKNFL